MWQIKFQDAKIRVDKEQTEVDVKLQLRVGDVEFWKGELDNKLAQLKEEIEEAVSLKFATNNKWAEAKCWILGSKFDWYLTGIKQLLLLTVKLWRQRK